ncbi:DNA repair protein XRCC4 [Calliopsis andreniformis]|uniref:DNA repair protein XRCC4 n=1 Tax=Calliopsis andreniformis TaxID=337506 RepID=UPI003FCC5CAA
MTEIHTSEIFNQIDEKYFTLYIEWFESCFKIMLLESTVTPLSGEMNTKDIDYYCNELSKSFNKYFEETKAILCGKDKDVQFFIQDKVFEWRKNIWTLGKIKLHSVLDIKVISESFQKSLKFYQTIQDKVNKLEEENKNLTCIKNELCSDLEKFIEIKTFMEQDLYKKFIVILNSKKKRLRELEDMLKEKQKCTNSIFDACTDESEKSDEENKKRDNDTKCSVSKKRKSADNNISKHTKSAKKKNTITKTDCSVDDVNTAGSSHKEYSCASGSGISRSSLNFMEESEEELFSD